jgi:hypothetical protein
MDLENSSYELFQELAKEVEKNKNKPTPVSCFIKESKILEKRIKKEKKFYESVSISQEKLYERFTI